MIIERLDAGTARAFVSAARHVYALRRRLADTDALQNLDHCYRLADRLTVARAMAADSGAGVLRATAAHRRDDRSRAPLATSRNPANRREVRA